MKKLVFLGLNFSSTVLYPLYSAYARCLRQVCQNYVPNEARQKYVPRNLRRESFQDYDAIIFVVDSADKDSFEEARRELWNFLRLLKEIM